MRYIKTYKIFESIDIIDTLNDICLELNDDGFKGYGSNGSDVKPVRVKGNFETVVTLLMTKDDGFYFDDIKDIIYRITGILGDKLDTFKYKDDFPDEVGRYWREGDIDKLKDESMENIKMYGFALWASKKL
jgi:hypothetical protein